ncbi:MAG: YfbM family protein [Candidatus Accumulibacter sp.]|jgi:hypothetical protein|nr:YfbM family protein [Accumulibacter sp.]
MGLLANYMMVGDDELDSLKALAGDDLVERIEELDEGEAPVYDLDKMWDLLHFTLTGVSASAPVEGNPLSEAVVGAHVFDTEDFIGCTKTDELSGIIAALEKFDWTSRRADFTAGKIRKAKLYPDLAESTPADYDNLWKTMTDEFHGLLAFYRQAAQAKKHVIVSIY